MNEQNVDYLANEMFYTGFGDIPRSTLIEKIKEGNQEFQIVHDRKFGNDSVRGRLNFKESDKNPGMYFYNSFDVLLKKNGKGETLQQNFSAGYGNRYKFKEAYNLLDGRSVNKDFIRVDRDDKEIRQEYNTWVYLDFKNTDDNGNFKIVKNYGYNLEKQLEGFPIKGIENDEDKSKLLESLKRGNREPVTIVSSRGEENMHVEAAVQFDSLKFYNEKMNPVRLSTNGVAEGKAIENGQTKSKDVSEGKKADDAEDNEEKQASRRRVKM